MPELTGSDSRTAAGAKKRYVIGLDIGTTSLCATAVDTQDGSAARTLVRMNQATMPAAAPDERLQDPDWIAEQLLAMLEEWRDLLPETAAIGISAQMHGILYVDERGRAVSPLYTWQDGRGDRPLPSREAEAVEGGATGAGQTAEGEKAVSGTAEGMPSADQKQTAFAAATYRQQLEALSGYPVPSGYGLLTHDVLRRTGGLPRVAAKLCTVGDYVAMRLAGRTSPLIDATQAAGLGLFDLHRRSFDTDAAARAGIDPALLPEIAGSAGALAGATPDGIPVAVAIGDNQASYLGAVPALKGSLLLNVGTGAQLSLYTPEPIAPGAGLELRPFPDGGWLLAGASLGGGKSYALLAGFYREIAETLGALLTDEQPGERERSRKNEDPVSQVSQTVGTQPNDEQPGSRKDEATISQTIGTLKADEQPGEREAARKMEAGAPSRAAQPHLPADRLYAAMNRWALEALDAGLPLPRVDAAFFGTRADPDRTAQIASLSPATFTPQALTAGLLAGVADELAAFAAQLPRGLRGGVRRLVGAGNGIRRNPALRRLLAERFDAPLELAEEREEAAFGAAVHAAVCAGIFEDYEEALQRMSRARLTEGDIV